MQHANVSNEVVLRLDVNTRHDTPLSFEQAASYLGNAIRMSNSTPYYYNFIDKPVPGDMHVIFQVGSLPPFSVDGLRYLEAEQAYNISQGVFELEVAETKYGFIPGSGEMQASRMRRKFRFIKGGMPAVVLVHYSIGPSAPVPPHIANQPVRKYPLIPPNEPGIFVMGERTGQKVHGHPPSAVNGQGPYPNPQQQQQQVAQLAQQQQIVRPPQPPVHAQNAAIAAQNAAMNAHRGPPPKPIISDENDEDESDLVTYRDIASTRFVRNHEFLAELFSAEPLPKEPAPSSATESVEELEATLARLQDEIASLEQKTTELETVKLTGETSQLAVSVEGQA